MSTKFAETIANPNIAFIKYWGDRDSQLRIPANGSISMNLKNLYSRTRVTFDPALASDELYLDGELTSGFPLQRVSKFLDHVRQMADLSDHAKVESKNNFPTGSGIASSASAFAALSLAASTAAGLQLKEKDLSRLARLGSGSACRSVPGGFVEWKAGQDDASSYAVSLASPDHWELNDCIAVVSLEHKDTGSHQGHVLADTSLLQSERVADTSRRLDICRNAILGRDFDSFAEIVELDSNMMHAVMMTSNPRLFYWHPATIAVMKSVIEMRGDGLPVCFTIDAGPNVHVLTPIEFSPQVIANLVQIPGVLKVLSAQPGDGVRLIEN